MWPLYMVTALLMTIIGLFLSVPHVNADEIKTKYAVIKYDNSKQLQRLNNTLHLSRGLAYELQKKNTITIQDEIAAKFDILIEKVKVVVDMYPEQLKYDVHLFWTAKDAQNALLKRYNKQVNFISFYSRGDNLLYLSVEDAELHVVAHELGHVVVEHYFGRSPPVRMHEVMAQYAETHISD